MKRSTFFKSLIGIAVAPSLLSGNKPIDASKEAILAASLVADADGGYLIPHEYEDKIQKTVHDYLREEERKSFFECIKDDYKKGNVSIWESK